MKKHGAKKGALLRFLVLTMFVLAFGGCGDRPEGSESVGEHSNLFESDMVTDMADSIESDNTSEMEESKEAASEKNEQSNSTLSEKPDMEATTSPTEESAQKKETTASKVEIVEEGILTSDKDVLDLLSESKKTTAEEIEFVCTGDLYDNLMDQNTGRIDYIRRQWQRFL